MAHPTKRQTESSKENFLFDTLVRNKHSLREERDYSINQSRKRGVPIQENCFIDSNTIGLLKRRNRDKSILTVAENRIFGSETDKPLGWELPGGKRSYQSIMTHQALDQFTVRKLNPITSEFLRLN